jgi:hypothetical protein
MRLDLLGFFIERQDIVAGFDVNDWDIMDRRSLELGT